MPQIVPSGFLGIVADFQFAFYLTEKPRWPTGNPCKLARFDVS